MPQIIVTADRGAGLGEGAVTLGNGSMRPTSKASISRDSWSNGSDGPWRTPPTGQRARRPPEDRRQGVMIGAAMRRMFARTYRRSRPRKWQEKALV